MATKLTPTEKAKRAKARLALPPAEYFGSPMGSIIDKSGGDLDKAIRLFNRNHHDLDADDRQIAADTFNAEWQRLVPDRPLKVARGGLRRIHRHNGIVPAGYRVQPGFEIEAPWRKRRAS